MDRGSNEGSRPGARMQDPMALQGPPPPAGAQKRQRQKRTVYTAEQQQELRRHFRMSPYPTYQARQDLAHRLMLREHQVQVWFQNQRTRFSRLQRLASKRGQGALAVHPGCGGPAPTLRGAPKLTPRPTPSPASSVLPEGTDCSNPGAPVLVPSLASPAFPESPDFCRPGTPGLTPSAADSAFSEDLDFRSPHQPSPCAIFPAEEPCTSRNPAWGCPVQDTLVGNSPVPTPSPSPTPDPAWSLDDPEGLSPEPIVIPDFTDLLLALDPWDPSPPASVSGPQEGDDAEADLKKFLNL